MNHSKYKYIFLFFGIIYLVDGCFTLFSINNGNYFHFGFSLSKNQEIVKQLLTSIILLILLVQQKKIKKHLYWCIFLIISIFQIWLLSKYEK